MKGVLFILYLLASVMPATAQNTCVVDAMNIAEQFDFTAQAGTIDKTQVYRAELIRASALQIRCVIRKDSSGLRLKPIIQGFTMQVWRGDSLVNSTYANSPYWSAGVQQCIQTAQDGDTLKFKDIVFGLSPCPYEKPRRFKAQTLHYVIKNYVDESEPLADMDEGDKKKGS